MYVVMDDSMDQMCYFKRLRKPRIAEERTTPVLRNKAERSKVQSNGIVCLASSGGDGFSPAAALAGERLGLSAEKRQGVLLRCAGM